MNTFINKTLTTTIIGVAAITLAACSSAPLTCDHALPTASQIQKTNTVVQLKQPKQLKKLPRLVYKPHGFTFSASNANVASAGSNRYVITVPTRNMNNTLIMRSKKPFDYAASISGHALTSFWSHARIYFNLPFHNAVVTTDGVHSTITRLNHLSYNQSAIQLHVTSSRFLQTNNINNIVVTVSQ